MATTATPPAESKPPQHKEVEHFSDSERTEWLKTGKMPALEQDPPVKTDGDQAPSTPVKESAGSGPAKKDKAAEEREAEKELNFKALRERTERAEAELEEYKTGKKKFEEKKEPAPAKKLLEMPKRPPMKDFIGTDGILNHEGYEAALDKYETDKTAYTNQEVNRRTADAQQQAILKEWTGEIKAKYGEKSSGLDVKKTVDALVDTQNSAPIFFLALQKTDPAIMADLVYVLGTDPKLEEFLAEAKDPKTVMDAVEKLVEIRKGVKAELAKGKKAASEDEEEKPEKKLTRAGKPPTESAGATSSPADDGSPEAAWGRKDLTREQKGELYRERKNKLEAAKRRKKIN